MRRRKRCIQEFASQIPESVLQQIQLQKSVMTVGSEILGRNIFKNITEQFLRCVLIQCISRASY